MDFVCGSGLRCACFGFYGLTVRLWWRSRGFDVGNGVWASGLGFGFCVVGVNGGFGCD